MSVIIVALIAIVIFLLLKENKIENIEVSDAQKFKQEYKTVPEDNVFTYATIDEILAILENGTGIIYLGFPECAWCREYVIYLNAVAKDRDIANIYYYNIQSDRNDNTKNYQQIVSFLTDYLPSDEEGNPRIYVPAVIFVRGGEIVGFDDETAYDTNGFSTPSEYWNAEEINDLKERLNTYIDNYSICTDCNS